MNAVTPFWRFSGEVDASTTKTSPTVPWVMNVLEPFRIQPPALRTAVDFIAEASEPEPGSVSAHAASHSPVASFGKYWISARRFRTVECGCFPSHCARRRSAPENRQTEPPPRPPPPSPRRPCPRRPALAGPGFPSPLARRAVEPPGLETAQFCPTPPQRA